MAEKGKAKKGRLRLHGVFHVPLREVSGVCLRRGRNRQMWLIAVGDRVAKLAWTSVLRDEAGSLDWRTIDIARLSGSGLPARDPQIEAVCADGAARVLLLQEGPPRAEVIDFRRPGLWRQSTSRWKAAARSPAPGPIRRARAGKESCSCPAATCSSPRRSIRRRSLSSVREARAPAAWCGRRIGWRRPVACGGWQPKVRRARRLVS
jgi:hypothetical protein